MTAEGTTRFHSEIESPRPLYAPAGTVTIIGWCFISGEDRPPPVRLSTALVALPASGGIERADVAALAPDMPAARFSGFIIQGTLPPGVHLAKFEAQLPTGKWRVFKQLSLVVKHPPLAAALDTPISQGTLHDRVRVGGWALQPDQPIEKLSLRYGHRDLPCRIGLVRDDVAAMFPDAAEACHAGFESSDFLWAGYGPVRLRAQLADGSIATVSTPVVFNIDRDENHDPDLELTAPRVVLPRVASRKTEPLAPASGKLNVCFLLPGSFAANSALHVSALANELVACGHDCVVSVAHDLDTIAQHSAPAFRALLHRDTAAQLCFADGRGIDIIHAWTTRENVRRLATVLRQKHQSKVIIHLEDNEQEILALSLGRSRSELAELTTAELDRLVPGDLSHPHHAQQFLAAADGITIITEQLREFAPCAIPCELIRPAADARYFFAQDLPQAFRSLIDRTTSETTIFYHGNVHASNAIEVRALYEAVLALNQSGHPVTLLRTGLNTVDFLGGIKEQVSPHVLELGLIAQHRHLPALMTLADIFVQPGTADAFNNYRFPSKLPEFFALGRPVILPRANLGAELRHGIDAYILDRADATGIARAVKELLKDRTLYTTLRSGAEAYAKAHFNWSQTTAALANFYGSLTQSCP